MKIWEVIVIISLLVSGSVYIISSRTADRISVGIVLIEGLDEDVGNVILEGFSEYEDHLDPILLEYRFNDSGVRMEGNFLLVSDHFDICPIESLKEVNDVDIILIVTSKLILDWDDSRMAFWGKAQPKYSAAIMTNHYWKGMSTDNITRWQHIAVHEVLHLFGYTHNPWNKGGIMQYAKNPDKLSLVPYYDFQFPLRSSMFQFTQGMSFRSVAMIMNLAVALLMLPLIFAQELIVNKFHKYLTVKERIPKWLGPLTITGCFFLLMAVTGTFIVLIFTMLFSILTHMTFHYLSSIKKKVGEIRSQIDRNFPNYIQ